MERVEIITDKQQKFNGEKFYLCGNYYQHKGKRLHRAVWVFYNGEIPKDCDIHHVDGNRANNNIENLQLLPKKEHHRKHMKEPERVAQSKKDIEIARMYASKWHGSEEGKKWHSIRGKENWKSRKENTYTCSYCGKEFTTKHIYGANQNHFCHSNCKAAYRRKRLKDESCKS